MSLEIILDILLSAIVLYVYHSDCQLAAAPQRLEFAPAFAVAAEAYDYACIPAPVAVADEWLLDADDRCYPSEAAVVMFAELSGIPATPPVQLTVDAASSKLTVKELRQQAKAAGVKNVSRLSKAALIEALAAIG